MRNTPTSRRVGVGWLRAVKVLTTLLAIAWSVLSAAPAWADDDTEQAVLAAHEKRRAATVAGDAAAVGSMMTDDLTFTHANAVVETKAEFLDALKTGRYQYKSLTDEERGVRVHGDAGIVSGTCRIVVTASGKDIDIRVRFTELWVKEGGAWRMFSGTRPMCPSRLVNTSRRSSAVYGEFDHSRAKSGKVGQTPVRRSGI